jgi:hypothetical protein
VVDSVAGIATGRIALASRMRVGIGALIQSMVRILRRVGMRDISSNHRTATGLCGSSCLGAGGARRGLAQSGLLTRLALILMLVME